jgi:hypothetical protein
MDRVSRIETMVEIRGGSRAVVRPFRQLLDVDPPPVMTPLLSILEGPEEIRPSGSALRDRFTRNFTGWGVPKSEHLEALNLEIVLTPEEALRGVVLRVGLPVFEVCSACEGTGHDGLSSCTACDGEGVVASEQAVPIHIAPMIRPGTVTDVLLDGFGVRNLCLRLHTFVSGDS